MICLDDHNARMNMLEKDSVLRAFVEDDIVYLDKDSQPEPTLSLFIDNVIQWHRDRNLIDGSTDKDQYMKLIQEAGELSDSLCKGKDIKDLSLIHI